MTDCISSIQIIHLFEYRVLVYQRCPMHRTLLIFSQRWGRDLIVNKVVSGALEVWRWFSLPGCTHCGRIFLLKGPEEETGLIVILTTWERNCRARRKLLRAGRAWIFCGTSLFCYLCASGGLTTTWVCCF